MRSIHSFPRLVLASMCLVACSWISRCEPCELCPVLPNAAVLTAAVFFTCLAVLKGPAACYRQSVGVLPRECGKLMEGAVFCVQPTVIDEVRTGTYRQLFHPGKPTEKHLVHTPSRDSAALLHDSSCI